MSVELNAEIGNYAFDIAQRYLAGKRHFSKWVLIPSDLHTSRCHQHAGTTGQLTPQAGAVLAAAWRVIIGIPARISIGTAVYGSLSSSSRIDIFQPLGVGA